MTLAHLYDAIGGEDWLERFVDYNNSDHIVILQALQVQKNKTIPLLAIGTATPDTLGRWALDHQILHDQTNAFFDIAGSDFTRIELNDQSALESMHQLHAEEHRRWHDLLGI